MPPEVEKANGNAVIPAVERRRAALTDVDEAPFSRFHVKTCIVAGVGFFTDAYDIFSISIAAVMIGYVYHQGGSNTANQDLGIKVAHSIGTLFGQLLFGWLADRVGRKRKYGIELIIIIVGTLGQVVAGEVPAISIYGVLVMWRFIMGMGIGGDWYPFIGRHHFRGWGNFTSAVVSVIAIVAYKTEILSESLTDLKGIDQAWRIIIGLGCVPGAIALNFRLTIPETPRYTMDIERNIMQATQDVDTYLTTGTYVVDPIHNTERAAMPKATWADFIRHSSQWKNFKILFGAAWSWFALGVAFYGLGLNSSTILASIGFGSYTKGTKQQNMYQTLYNVAVGNIILAIGGLIPGYCFTMAFVDFWGRKPIQLMGFILLTNFGPNTTPFIIPGEVFPTRYRSTGHGISAASGKLGAIIAQVGFSRLVNIGGPNAWLNHILELFAFFMVTGIFSTLLLTETKDITLEALSNEEQTKFVNDAGVSPVSVEVARISSEQRNLYAVI